MSSRPGNADDLANLSDLDEAILLAELKVRYNLDKIYTYVGDILVAINPFKDLPIYSDELRVKYQKTCLAFHPPHIFAIADAAYQLMLNIGRHQSCVISGESGAGKTESAKLLVSHLIWLSGGKTILGQKILQVNPLLEAFGNAKTLINNNSSRFGKYLQLKFKNGKVSGAKINEYLLEKSRVVFQNPQEGNFHVFYYMFAGLSDEQELYLTDPTTFQYLRNESASSLHSASQGAERFAEVCNSLDLVGFEADMQNSIFACLAAILHLGNIQFQEDGNEYSYVLDPRCGPINTVAELLGVDVQDLMDVLTVNISHTRGEVVRRHWSKATANAVRDALAKALYDRIFRWIVNKINQLLAPTAAQMVDEKEIGILDIFGFEKFEENSFEQLCINMANEQLQFFFVEHVFFLEKDEYRKEGVTGLDINCITNKSLLDLFFSKPIGILSLLDEECSFPRASDQSFVTKLNQVLKKKNPSCFISSKDTASICFSLVHYAGKVEYSSYGFLDKNRDAMPKSATVLLRCSTNDLIRLLFTANISRTGTLTLNSLTCRRLRKKTVRGSRGGYGRGGGSTNLDKPSTVGAQFKNSLQVLIEKIKGADPHFIRCIRPNTLKTPGDFHTETIITQLKYTGMLETIRIRREGYPIRHPFGDFIAMYGIVASTSTLPPSADSCQQILHRAGCDGYRVGKTKVFLKQWHSDRLWQEVDRAHRAATVLQKVSRGFVERVRFRGLLSVKQYQKYKLVNFLLDITCKTNDLLSCQIYLCELDEENVPPSAPPLEFCIPPPPTNPPPGSPSALTRSLLCTPHGPLVTSFFRLLPPAPPPPNFLAPPPEPYFTDSGGEDMAHGEHTTTHEEGGGRDDILFVAPPRDGHYKTFGREGTRSASLRWFKETQAKLLRSSSSGKFPEWFHGILSKRKAEKLLADKPQGNFLVRACENRFGYSLSVKRSDGSCLHHMISQLESTGKYVVVGEPKVYPDLSSILRSYSKSRVLAGREVLTQPCCTKNIEAAASLATDMDLTHPHQESSGQQKWGGVIHSPRGVALDKRKVKKKTKNPVPTHS